MARHLHLVDRLCQDEWNRNTDNLTKETPWYNQTYNQSGSLKRVMFPDITNEMQLVQSTSFTLKGRFIVSRAYFHEECSWYKKTDEVSFNYNWHGFLATEKPMLFRHVWINTIRYIERYIWLATAYPIQTKGISASIHIRNSSVRLHLTSDVWRFLHIVTFF